MTLADINSHRVEGRLLLAALAILTTNNYTDKTPDEVLEILKKTSDDMFKAADMIKEDLLSDAKKAIENSPLILKEETQLVGQLKMWPQSSQVISTDYDAVEQRLIVTFRGNKSYEYNHFPKEKYDELLKCESIGSFINKEVKGKFNYRPLEAGEVLQSAGRRSIELVHTPINAPDL